MSRVRFSLPTVLLGVPTTLLLLAPGCVTDPVDDDDSAIFDDDDADQPLYGVPG